LHFQFAEGPNLVIFRVDFENDLIFQILSKTWPTEPKITWVV
jgi:hypothetical protein